MAEVKAYVDNGKRSRILFLAASITISILVSKIMQSEDITSGIQALGKASIYFLVTYFGLLWALRFQVGGKSLMYVLPQSALFVFSEVLFLDLFLFRAFDRIYETFLLVFILILVFMATYISFLTANVFNVARFRTLPLEQAGKTASYILSLFSVYFLTFAFLAAGLEIFFLVPFAFVSYLIIVYAHIQHLGVSKKYRRSGVVGTVWAMLILLVASLFVSSSHEVIALIPTVTMYSMIGVVLGRDQDDIKWVQLFEYGVVIVVSIWLLVVLG